MLAVAVEQINRVIAQNIAKVTAPRPACRCDETGAARGKDVKAMETEHYLICVELGESPSRLLTWLLVLFERTRAPRSSSRVPGNVRTRARTHRGRMTRAWHPRMRPVAIRRTYKKQTPASAPACSPKEYSTIGRLLSTAVPAAAEP